MELTFMARSEALRRCGRAGPTLTGKRAVHLPRFATGLRRIRDRTATALRHAEISHGGSRQGQEQLDDTYHRVIVVLLALGFLTLVLPHVQRAFAARVQGRSR
jgi:hypothetical protein